MVPAVALLAATLAVLPLDPGPDDRIRGVTLAPIEDQRLGPVGYGTERSAIALAEAADLGATWVSLTPFGRLDDLEDTDVLHDFEIPAATNEKMLREAAAQARALGLKVAIIPHVYVMSGQWRGEIDPGDEQRWADWFRSYERFVLRFARLAQELHADLFSIGVEFKSSTNARPAAWRRVIAKVRSAYSGPVTYSANWDEVADVEFWDALDAIGLNAFWPLAGKPGDRFEVMRERARRRADELAGLALFWNRPVIFMELGTKSASDASLAPWEWPEHCDDLSYDEDYQAEAFEAVLEAFAPRPWFGGLFVWKYFSDPYDETQEPRTGFSPRGKRAEDVLSDWFRRGWGETGLDLFPE
ncbi:MAG: hypothetical protein PHU25_00600 [Deltaproteobacteria bacterium]|nr:hypothetical protein [Deltaproteobacteria bacterium]